MGELVTESEQRNSMSCKKDDEVRVPNNRPMNINNEMIIMRKEIKRAKVWIISKLVRNSRHLRNKKGTDEKIKKNIGRADRLVEEIYVIRALKPDDIFKALLQSDRQMSDLMRLNLSIGERAIVRIGAVKFIKERMEEIKANISAFHYSRSHKLIPSSLQVAQELKKNTAKTNSDGVKTRAKLKDPPLVPEVELVDENENVANTSKKHCKGPSMDTTKEQLTTKRNLGESLPPEPGKIDDEVANPRHRRPSKEDHSDCVTESAVSFEQNNISDDEEIDRQASGSSDGDDDCAEPKEVIIGTTEDGYQIVLPPSYKQSNENGSMRETAAVPDFNAVAKDAVDVTEVLPNIGEGFNSPDESSDSEENVDYEDLLKSGKKENSGSDNDEEENGDKVEEDLFFVDKKGSSDNNFTRQIKKSSQKEVSDEGTKEIKSSFLGSLSRPDSQNVKGKKNRPSQRARKKAQWAAASGGASSSVKSSENRRKVSGKTKVAPERTKTREGSGAAAATKNANETTLHPSWEASRKRKQEQTTFKPFQGKRVCFEDSD